VLLHEFNAFERFERPDENGRGGPSGFADHVEHEVSAVIEENIDVAWRQVHGANARRGAAKVMAGRISGRIRFRLHDAPAQAAGGDIVNHNFAEKKAGERDGARREF
jgi:hypothetical protein